MNIAQPSDLSLELLCHAYRNLLPDAGERAKADQLAYAADVNGLHAELLELVNTNDQKRICDHEIERYRQGYLKRFSDYLHALWWCPSPGKEAPHNVNRLEWVEQKLSQFTDWRSRARKTIKAKVAGEDWRQVIENEPTRIAGKAVILGMVERDGNIALKTVPNTQKDTLYPVIEQSIRKGTEIHTDKYHAYHGLTKAGYGHKTVSHSTGQHVIGDCHVNTIEGMWFHLQKAIRGTHVWVSGKHLDKYAAEFSFRFNLRKVPASMLPALLSSFLPVK